MSTLQGQHALVTGANRGIGAATVRALAAAGADVTLLVRNRDAGETVASDLPTRSHVVVADVIEQERVREACARAETALGPISILVNNAGHAGANPFHRASPDDFVSMFRVHVLGAVHTAQCVLPGMVERSFGRIVNVASVAGLSGAAYVAPYVTAKHGLVGLTRALAAEYASRGITVNAVCPGYTDTDLVSESVQRIVDKTGRTPEQALAALLADAGQQSLITVQEVADAIVRFCEPSAAQRNAETWTFDLDLS